MPKVLKEIPNYRMKNVTYATHLANIPLLSPRMDEYYHTSTDHPTDGDFYQESGGQCASATWIRKLHRHPIRKSNRNFEMRLATRLVPSYLGQRHVSPQCCVAHLRFRLLRSEFD